MKEFKFNNNVKRILKSIIERKEIRDWERELLKHFIITYMTIHMLPEVLQTFKQDSRNTEFHSPMVPDPIKK